MLPGSQLQDQPLEAVTCGSALANPKGVAELLIASWTCSSALEVRPKTPRGRGAGDSIRIKAPESVHGRLHSRILATQSRVESAVPRLRGVFGRASRPDPRCGRFFWDPGHGARASDSSPP